MNRQHRSQIDMVSSKSLLVLVLLMLAMALVSYAAFAPGGPTLSGALKCFVGVLPFLGLVGIHAMLSRS
jgi:hypothetical protein